MTYYFGRGNGKSSKTVKLMQQLSEIDDNIKQGEELSAMGYDCGFMLDMTKSIRADIIKQMEEHRHD